MKCRIKNPSKRQFLKTVWGHHGLCRPVDRYLPGRFRIDSFADSGSPSTHSLWWKQPATHAASRGHGCRFDGVATGKYYGLAAQCGSNESSSTFSFTRRFVLPMRCRTSRWPVRRLSGISSWVLVALGNRSLNGCDARALKNRLDGSRCKCDPDAFSIVPTIRVWSVSQSAGKVLAHFIGHASW